MTKAQQVRSNRLAKLHNDINVEATKIFDWILDVFDKNTENGDYGPITVFLFSDEKTIKIDNKDGCYNDLETFFFHHDRVKLFTALRNVIEQEDGFTAVLKTDTAFWDKKAIVLEVVMN